MLENSLEIEKPWYIDRAEFDEKEKQFNIYVKVERGARFCCPKCSGITSRNGYETEERAWRHNDAMGFKCFVRCNRPKVKCEECGSMQITAPYERKNSRFTLMFEGYTMMIAANMPISKTAELLRCDEKSVVSIMKHWVDIAVDSTDLSEVTALAIDETSFKKGHSYVTVIIDAQEKKVIDIEEGKDKETVRQFAQKLEEKGGSKDKIEVVTSDMSTSFLPAIEENFENAKNVIDKFHVKKIMIDALDKVRKEEQKLSEDKNALFRKRRLLMIPESKLTDEQKEDIDKLSKVYPKSGRAYRMVSALDEFYNSETIEEAQMKFDKLYSWLIRSKLEPMKKAAKTLKNHKEKIVLYFEYRYTNAICEGINSMIQAAKRKARGFHTFESYATMIYLIAGKLQLACPTPFL